MHLIVQMCALRNLTACTLSPAPRRHCPSEPRSVRPSWSRSRTMSLMSRRAPPVRTVGGSLRGSGSAAWAHQNLLEGCCICTQQGRVWAGRRLCRERPGVLLLLSSHLGKHCAGVAEPACAEEQTQFSGCQTALQCFPAWPVSCETVLPAGYGVLLCVSFLMLSNVTLQYFRPWQECNVAASLWFNLHLPWLLARLQIFPCLLDNGFALLGIACSYYLLIFIIDLFDFLLTFFVGYMCWEIAPGGRLPFSLVYALLFGKEC